jgi:hypothetical protein
MKRSDAGNEGQSDAFAIFLKFTTQKGFGFRVVNPEELDLA